MTIEPFIQQIRQHISLGQLPEALQKLRDMLQHTPHLNEAIQQSARYEDICRQTRLGIAGQTEASTTLNQITWGVLELLSKLEGQSQPEALNGLLTQVEELGKQADIYAELERAISVANSKNVVAGATLSAAGNIHIGDIIYQDAPQKQASLRHDFNKKLTRMLTEALAPYSDNAKRLVQDFSWLHQPADLRKVQNFICRSFIGEVGKQIRDLINIGDFEGMEAEKKQRHYMEKCLDIARRSFEVINYSLLSVWWDVLKNGPQRPISEAQRSMLVHCFDKHFEHTLQQQFKLLQMLHGLFVEHQIAFPFQAMEQMSPQLQAFSPLEKSCEALQGLLKSACTLADCEEAETELGSIMRHFGFLALYRMASIKKIAYRQIRNDEPHFLHRYVALGIDKKFSEDAEKINYSKLGEQTPAVLLYPGDNYQHGINLFPFVIDYNALTFEQGAKVCFFSATDLSDGALEYRFVADNSIVRIEKTGILKPDTDLNELLMQPDSLKMLNLDCVVDGFRDARRTILGANEHLNLDEL